MRVFTVLGPSHSGKTTLVEALAGLDGGKPRKLEFFGGATATVFDFMGEPWAAFDIPGGMENIAEAGPVLAASDAAVLCVPPEAEAAVLSAPYLRVLEEAGLPALIFINRIDAAADRVSEVVSALQTYCAHGIVLRQVPMRQGDEIVGAVDLISERAWEYHEGTRSTLVELPEGMRAREQEARAELLEQLADFDDALLEQLIEDQRPMTGEVYDVATKVLQHHDLVPALLGAALHGNGILRLMKTLRHEVPAVDEVAERLPGDGVLAVGCMADQVKHLGKTVLVRALGAGVAAGAPLCGDTIGNLTEIDARTQISALKPGEIGLTVKTDHLTLGGLYTAGGTAEMPAWAQPHVPVHRWMVAPVHEKDETRLSSALARLTEIDPGLGVEQDETSGHAILSTQGPLHLRRVIDKLADWVGIEVTTEEVPASLYETISKPVEKHHRHRKQSGGAGQFADVVIGIAPQERGAGFAFAEEIKGGAVPRNYIPAVEAGVQDALKSGPNGYPVVDIAVTLKDGKHHAVDSSDFAFRTAGKNAVREALAEARPLLLQPIMRVEIHVPSVFAGGLVPVISGLKGQVLGFEAHPDNAGWDVFRTLLPKSAEPELFRALGGATRGTAWFTAELDHYEELREAAPAH